MADRLGTFHELHPDKVIVSMVRFHDKIIVATAWDIFELSPDDGRISPLQLKEAYQARQPRTWQGKPTTLENMDKEMGYEPRKSD